MWPACTHREACVDAAREKGLLYTACMHATPRERGWKSFCPPFFSSLLFTLGPIIKMAAVSARSHWPKPPFRPAPSTQPLPTIEHAHCRGRTDCVYPCTVPSPSATGGGFSFSFFFYNTRALLCALLLEASPRGSARNRARSKESLRAGGTGGGNLFLIRSHSADSARDFKKLIPPLRPSYVIRHFIPVIPPSSFKNLPSRDGGWGCPDPVVGLRVAPGQMLEMKFVRG